jgi:hypothetical protein
MEKRGEEIMPRPYSDKFILGLNKGDPKSKGVQLAKICVKAGLPAKYVANVFGVSRMSIFTVGLEETLLGIKILLR